MKVVKRILLVTLGVVLLLCLLSCWRDISVFIPQRLTMVWDNLKMQFKEIFSHFGDVFKDSVQEVKSWYEGIFS